MKIEFIIATFLFLVFISPFLISLAKHGKFNDFDKLKEVVGYWGLGSAALAIVIIIFAAINIIFSFRVTAVATIPILYIIGVIYNINFLNNNPKLLRALFCEMLIYKLPWSPHDYMGCKSPLS